MSDHGSSPMIGLMFMAYTSLAGHSRAHWSCRYLLHQSSLRSFEQRPAGRDLIPRSKSGFGGRLRQVSGWRGGPLRASVLRLLIVASLSFIVIRLLLTGHGPPLVRHHLLMQRCLRRV